MSLLIKKLEHKLAKLKYYDHYRRLSLPIGHDFCSNDYYNLSKNNLIKKNICEYINSHEFGSTSSRFIRGNREIYYKLEQDLAKFKNSQKSVIFQSGYTANLGVLSSLISPQDIVFCDQQNHASIFDGLKLSGARIILFDKSNISDLVTQIKLISNNNLNKFLITESLFSMDGVIAPLDIYAQISQNFNLNLIIDESHAVGLYSKNNSGLINYFNIADQVTCSINGLGKAFGCMGAFVAGPEVIINYIIQKARPLMYSTALPPSILTGISKSLEIICDNNNLKHKLFKNINYLQDKLQEYNLINQRNFLTPIFPILLKNCKKSLDISKKLQEQNFDIRAIRPPTVPKNTSRLRITTNISHSFDLIDNLILILRDLL